MAKEFELVYSTQRSGFEKGRAYSNPRFFSGTPRSGVTKVIVVGNFPNVVAAYERVGVPVEVVKGPRMVGESAGPAKMTAESSKANPDAEIPQAWSSLPWLEKRLLAQNFSKAPVINGAQADEVIRGELQRRTEASPQPAAAQEGPSDEDMREAVKQATGRYPHPAMSRDKLLEQYEATKASGGEQ